MKLGIFLLSENYTNNTLSTILNDIELGVYADQIGFDELWFGEHHFNNFSVIPNPSLMMAALALKTNKIRIGSAGFLAPFYHPTRLSEEIATLDNLSLGRINAGFAKGGFALDVELFEKSSDALREEMFVNIKKIEENLANAKFEPKLLQKKLPIFIATFSTKITIEFAAKNGYGLMFSQGATLKECEEAQEIYKNIAGYYPQIVLMRVYATASKSEDAKKCALVATDHFVKCMRSIQSSQTQPKFNQENYDELLKQRYDFFDGKKFMDVAIVGTNSECIEHIKHIKRRIVNLHLVLKVASSNSLLSRSMLQEFMTKIKPHI